ncbi:thioredoxin domain [Dinoroseobacter phage DFL12phi1]|uniref:Host-like protein n=1 Tax=Dinoroseobacter phage DFL12phi1 TaxID=1477404 RepID=A0A023NHA9_9CAUD|nr:thioredoxin domain [Dinoroseobacter phage DFL12phi1]AHX01005.1 putative host-like protein [Dinoroseobacter phage DFL12phi1]
MIRTLSDADFVPEMRENTDPIVVMFTGSWCQPCKRMKPVFEDMAEQMQGDIRFAEMDIEQAEKTANELGIRSVPSLALFADGMIREIHAGTMNKTELRLWIQENI